ncbi:MAG: hypothetical protein U1U88_002196 [Lawsonella clevelandensis]
MDIYEGGYTVTFHRAPTAQALQQVALNRYKEALGFYGSTPSPACRTAASP